MSKRDVAALSRVYILRKNRDSRTSKKNPQNLRLQALKVNRFPQNKGFING